ncbi:MAG: DNA replication/repair protein RecF [Gammaproteobacteria bacterium]
MALTRVVLSDFRNLVSVDIEPGPGLNIFVGSNGAGKTSFLEAIVYLARGRPLRSGRSGRIIRDGAEISRVVVETSGGSGVHRLGFEIASSALRLRCDGERAASFLDLGRHLPVRFFGPDSQLLVDGGPEVRRSFLDWGLFHVEHDSLSVMSSYRRALRQRNRMLSEKRLSPGNDVFATELGRHGQRWTALRTDHVEKLAEQLSEETEELTRYGPITLQYKPGYAIDVGLIAELESHIQVDLDRLYTGVGCHRADLDVRLAGRGLKGRISRGQQKMTTYRLLRAQAKLLSADLGRDPIFLIDDLGSELDPNASSAILDDLRGQGWQVFASVLPGTLDRTQYPDAQWFHVEQETIQPVL